MAFPLMLFHIHQNSVNMMLVDINYQMNTYLGSKLLSLTMHSFFSPTPFQVLGSARSTSAFAFSNPNPNLLFTISPAPFFFHPGLLANGSNSDVQTTKCCISLQVRLGLLWEKKIPFSLYTLKNQLAGQVWSLWWQTFHVYVSNIKSLLTYGNPMN